MKIIKFGGTSVANAQRIEQIANIISNYYKNDKLVIVVSALSGVTNLLEKCGNDALTGANAYTISLKEIEEKHFEIISKLVEAKNRSEIAAKIKMLCNEAEDICNGISILGEYSARSKAKLLSLGELMSSNLISCALNHLGHDNIWLDSRNIIKTDNTYTSAKVDYTTSEINAKKAFENITRITLMPGFIASNAINETTTLGRGGSDFTAALIANFINAERVDIWTDVNGMLTASPKIVSSAYTIPSISYEEAMELSHFGAKVIYPPTIQPAMEKRIPIMIKNSFDPEHTGTLISETSEADGSNIKGFSSIDNISLINISGSGMIGIPGFAMRTFKALSEADINVYLITQSSSEHTISVGIASCDANSAVQKLNEEFEIEISRHKVNKATSENNLSIVAIVGDKMKHSVGISGRAFKLLGDNGINVRAIAQGGTERNISVVISEKDTKKALNALHDGFFLSKYRKVHLFAIGLGTVGGTMLDQLNEQFEYLRNEYSLEIRLAGIANSRKMLFNEDGINLATFRNDLENSDIKMDLGKFVETVKEMNLRNSIFMDNTASADIAEIYKPMVELKIPVVASNKIMASSPLEKYIAFKQAAKKNNVMFLNETNVAAGLPVLKTIEDLVASGDKITKIQAVLSGSLNYIFNNISETVSFSEAVIKARELGLTEPDPSIDLSGLDVRRKILILARTSGYNIELNEVDKNDIVPEKELQATNFDELLKNLEANNAQIENIRKDAHNSGKKLRYVAEYNNGKAVTGLQAVDSTHPAYNLDGMDNIILLYTRRYSEQPLVVKGAGAGPGVTASGVFADVMRLANN